MTLPLEKSLADARQEVGIRAGLDSSGKLGAKLSPLVRSLLNESQRQIYTRAYWARRARRLEVATVANVTDYDIPDATTIGGLHSITIQNADTPPREFPLRYDDALETQDFAGIVDSRPQYFQIIDDVIRVVPAADPTKYPKLILVVELAATDLVAEADRLSVDSEAVIQLTTIKLKEYLGVGGDTTRARAEFERYLMDLRSLVAPNRSYSIASRTADGPAYWSFPSTNAYSTPYTSDWNPAGF